MTVYKQPDDCHLSVTFIMIIDVLINVGIV
jgi:hypothetical protein